MAMQNIKQNGLGYRSFTMLSWKVISGWMDESRFLPVYSEAMVIQIGLVSAMFSVLSV